MELRQLRYFRAIAEGESFHGAAERLNIAQPALTRQMQALQTELGVRLFERQSRGVRLTQAGHSFLEDVRRILADVARAEDRVRRAAQGQLGTIHIGFNEIAARRPYLPGFFKTVRARYPDADMRLSLLTSQAQLDALRAGRIDAGFLFNLLPGDDEFAGIPVEIDNYVVAMPSAHRLANRKRLRLADLRDEPFIMMSQHINRQLHERLHSVCVTGGLVPRLVHEANNEHAIVNLVAAGVGLAFLNSSFDLPDIPDVRLRRVEDLSVPVELTLVWRRDNHVPLLARFTETVREMVSAGAAAARRGHPS